MAKKTDVVLNYNGVGKLMKSEWINNILQTQANRVADLAGDGFSTSSYPAGKTRSNVSVYPDTYEAYQDVMENNKLRKIIEQLRIN